MTTGTVNQERRVADAQAAALLLVRVTGQPGRLSEFELVDRIRQTEQLISWAQAQKVVAVAELSRRPGMQPESKPRNSEALSAEYITATTIAPALRITDHRAETLVSESIALDTRLPVTLRALAGGDIDWERARAVVEYTSPVADAAAAAARAAGASPAEARQAGDDVCARMEDLIHPHAARQNPKQLKGALNRAAAAVDPDAAGRRCRAARKDRRVWLRPEPDAMATFGAHLPAEDGIRLHNTLVDHAHALRKAGDPRTLEQLKVDLLVDLVTGRVSNGYTGTDDAPSSAQTIVQVTVGLTTLLGLDGQPGELEGYGPIPADLARRIADDPASAWYRLITDPITGILQHVDTRKYTPPAPLARFVQTRDTTCTHPGCTRPAVRCDLYHRNAFRADGTGGGTCEHNLNPRCERHHRCKHETGWRVDRIRAVDPTHDDTCPDAGTLTRDDLTRPDILARLDPRDRDLAARAPDGTLVYRSPDGHLYLVPPDPVLPVDPPAPTDDEDPPY